MINGIVQFLRVFLIIYCCVFLTGCGFLDWWLGKDAETIVREADTDGDGKLSKEEIKASGYDLNGDGKLSEAELAKAMEGSEVPTQIAEMLAVLNVPFAGGLALALKKFKEYKGHSRALIGGIEDLIALKKDGYTKEDIYTAMAISKKHRTDAKKLGQFVEFVKNEIRLGSGHLSQK